MTDLCDQDVAAIAGRIKSKEVSPVEVAEAFLRRIEDLNPKLNAFMTVTAPLTQEPSAPLQIKHSLETNVRLNSTI